MVEINISIEDLHDYIKDHGADELYVKGVESEAYTPIEDVTMKPQELVGELKVYLSDDEYKILRPGLGHIFYKNGVAIKLADIPYAEDVLLDGIDETMVLVKRIPSSTTVEDVYDVSVSKPHLYVHDEDTPLISHNTLYMANFVADAIRQGYSVAVFTLEDGTKKWAGRIDQNLMKVKQQDLKDRGAENSISFKRIIKKGLGVLKIEMLPTGSGTVGDMRYHLKEWKTNDGFEPDLIVADYIGIMNSTVTTNSAYDKYKTVAEEFRALGQELDAATLSAQQFKRDAFGSRHPGMEDTQDSIGIPQTADAIVGVVDTPNPTEHLMIPLKSRSCNPASLRNASIKVDTERQIVVDSQQTNMDLAPKDKKKLKSLIEPPKTDDDDAFDFIFSEESEDAEQTKPSGDDEIDELLKE